MAFHIIGDQDTVLGYRFAGVTGVVAENRAEALAAFRDALANKENRILLLTEAVDAMIAAAVTEHRLSAAPPYIVVVRDIQGTNVERRSLNDMVHYAVGIKLVTEKD